MIVMSNALSQFRRLQGPATRAHLSPLLFLLAACSASPVSIGSGIDSQESALTSGDGTEIDCTDNPLLPVCPTADGTENCADNPLLPGCPTAEGTENCSDNPLLPGCPTAEGTENCSDNPLLP